MAEEGTSDLESKDKHYKIDLCHPCSVIRKSSVAARFCKECEELMCTDCVLVHESSKATKQHELVDMDQLSEHGIKLDPLKNKSIRSEPVTSCEPCSIKGKTTAANFYCKECEEYLCSECKIVHASSKATKAHMPIDSSLFNEQIGKTSTCNESKMQKSCEPCAETGKASDATRYCKECEEMLCNNCTQIHSSSKATKAHVPVDINEMPEKPTKTCEPCLGYGKNCAATRFCEACDEFLCELCCKTHTLQKATKTHIPIHVDTMKASIPRKCDLCYENKTEAPATMFCPICDDAFCAVCTNAHRNQRATKHHKLIIIEDAIESTRLCDPCASNDTKQPALYYCSDCEECMCRQCSQAHRSQKATRNHTLLDINSIPESNARNCDPCKENDKCVPSTMFCQTCNEAYCEACTRAHKSQKATRGHELIQITEIKEDESKLCDVCKLDEKSKVALQFCKDCFEYLCDECCKRHTRQKASKNHQIISVKEANADYNEKCEPCLHSEQNVAATSFCTDCDEFLCESCCKQHKAQKSLRSHVLVSVFEGIELKSTEPKPVCEICRSQNRNKKATSFCTSCEEPEHMCEECAKQHTTQKGTRSHVLTHLSTYQHKIVKEKNVKKIRDTLPSKMDDNKAEEADPSLANVHHEELRPDIPGKPRGSEIKADYVKLHWDASPSFSATDYYQIRYKDLDSKGKWKFYPKECTIPSAVIADLKANTKFVFQVRVAHEETEGQYGPQSDEIWTPNSPARRMLGHSTLLEKGNPSPDRYSLPITEDRSARNIQGKTKKYDIGSPPINGVKERTIMLVGATGAGKSTLVDGIVNYAIGVNWNDPFRYTVISLEKEESDRLQNQALSQTEWITCYGINPEMGSRLDYRLNIIDTPGFGDTRGLKRDKEIVEQIHKLLSGNGSKGVVCIDAVCFLIKAPDARLTATQNYIFSAIMSLFGQDIKDNICSLITFADGVDPQVLSALAESKLPFGRHFTFNNSGLFAKNVNLDSSNLSPMFWDMGCKSFKAFFDHIDTMSTKSLQLTKQVLEERKKLETTVENLQPNVTVGLSMLNEFKKELQLFEQHKLDLEANKDFEYEEIVPKFVEKKLACGVYVTNCLVCNTTCHKNCAYADDNDKAKCCVMNADGNCNQCPQKCNWQKHKNMTYLIEIEHETKKVTLRQKLEKYQQAAGKKLTVKNVIEDMTHKLQVLQNGIISMMASVKKCTDRLQEIALRPNPLNMVEHINLMIEAEKMDKKDGFQKRITALKEIRESAEIGKKVDFFSNEVDKTMSLTPVEISGDDTSQKEKFSLTKFFHLRSPPVPLNTVKTVSY